MSWPADRTRAIATIKMSATTHLFALFLKFSDDRWRHILSAFAMLQMRLVPLHSLGKRCGHLHFIFLVPNFIEYFSHKISLIHIISRSPTKCYLLHIQKSLSAFGGKSGRIFGKSSTNEDGGCFYLYYSGWYYIRMISPRMRIILIRSLTVITGLLLIIIIFGIYPNFNALRTAITAGFFALAIMYFIIGYNSLAIVGVALGLFFFPPASVHLPRYIWVVIDMLSLSGIIFIAWWSTNPYWKGTLFEQYISKIFAEPDFVVVNRTRDMTKFSNRLVESDRDPDFVFRNQKTGRAFAVECKWRAKWYKDKNGNFGIHWGLHRCDNYISYGEKFKIPVLVAFGIGGLPEKPREVYFLDSQLLHYSFLKQSLIRSGKTKEQVVI